MTVQNMLLLLGLPPNFEREDFPPRKELYPFSLHLERLSQKSLAKYVVAEAPFDATDIDDIIQLAQESAGAAINHVGVLYGLLGVVFATEEQVQEGGSGSTRGTRWCATCRRRPTSRPLRTPGTCRTTPSTRCRRRSRPIRRTGRSATCASTA